MDSRILSLAVCAALGVLPSVARADGLAQSSNFLVIAPDQPTADYVLSHAEQLRTELATSWFGRALPPSIGATIIHVELKPNENSGLFWPIGPSQRKFHKLWVKAESEQAVAEVLNHELAHVVFAAHLRQPLPAWIDEGAASLLDDEERKSIRRDMLDWFEETGNWPNLRDVMHQETMAANDMAAYTVAASLVEYLLSVNDKAALISFAKAGVASGWEAALQREYGIASLADLQRNWQASVSASLQATATRRTKASR